MKELNFNFISIKIMYQELKMRMILNLCIIVLRLLMKFNTILIFHNIEFNQNH